MDERRTRETRARAELALVRFAHERIAAVRSNRRRGKLPTRDLVPFATAAGASTRSRREVEPAEPADRLRGHERALPLEPSNAHAETRSLG